MNEVEMKLEKCFRQIRSKVDFKPDVALILGSGLGDLADEIESVASVDYNEIDGFPVSTVSGHRGRFVFGYMEGTPVVVMQGRIHYYEGYPMTDVVLPTRLMGKLGARVLFLTNAAGGISNELSPGDLMMLTDQISSFVPSPLIGPNAESMGERFPSMDTIYNEKLRSRLRQIAEENDIPLKEGIYLQTTGPNYESPAEVRMFAMLGAHAVGMSTAVEAIAARHMGMRVLGISCITNMAGGTSDRPLSHEEVKEAADKAAPCFKTLVRKMIGSMNNE